MYIINRKKAFLAIAKRLELDENGLAPFDYRDPKPITEISDGLWREIERATDWLFSKRPTVRINPAAGTSYALKYHAQRDEGGYISNAAFIIAAVHCGFKVKQDGRGPNAFLNILTKGLP